MGDIRDNEKTWDEEMCTIHRYKIGYRTDDWGMRSSTPIGIQDASGSWVRYSDHVAVIAACCAQHRHIEELESELAAAQRDARRIEMLTTIEDSGEGLRYGLECLVNNGVNTFVVYDEQREEYMGDGWLKDPCAAIDAAIEAKAKKEGEKK